jgi:hypothetical protein
MLRAWQLALLRLAVTLDDADRLHVMAIAVEIDRGGHRPGRHVRFSFFRRTSIDLCNSLLRRHEAAEVTLRRFVMHIEDARLRRAFGAALELDPAPKVGKSKSGNGLWRGLTSRADVRRGTR